MNLRISNFQNSLLAAAVLIVATVAPAWAGQGNAGNPGVSPPGSQAYGKWSAAWWEWALELPIVDSAGHTHPFIDDPSFDVTEGQSGQVWFLAGSFGAARTCTVPPGKALFFALLNSECSS